MSIENATARAEELLVLAEQADTAITAFRVLLSSIHEKEREIVAELSGASRHPAWAGPMIKSGQSGLALYAAGRARLPQSTPNPSLTGPSVFELSVEAWGFLDPELPGD